MEHGDVICPHCLIALQVERGNWPYTYSQLLLHLSQCASEWNREQRLVAARAAADRATGENVLEAR